eukprot:3194195-Alexandrium_andersonii.AAC.1
MSASLVGSEMCIRDSPPSHGACRTAQPAEWEHAVPHTSWRGSFGPPGAVSYTHLTLPTICSV